MNQTEAPHWVESVVSMNGEKFEVARGINDCSYEEFFMFAVKHVKAIIRDPSLRKALIDHDPIPLDKFANFDLQDDATQTEIIETLDYTLQELGPFQLHFPSPVDCYPDIAWIYGTRGVYVLRHDVECIVFSRKVDAVRRATETSDALWHTAESSGLASR